MTSKVQELLEQKREAEEGLIELFGLEDEGDSLIDLTLERWDYYVYEEGKPRFTFRSLENKIVEETVESPRLVRKGDYFVLVENQKLYLFLKDQRAWRVKLGDYGDTVSIPEEEKESP